MSTHRPLVHHFRNLQATLLARADEASVLSHPTNRGNARELVVSEFLSRSFPSGLSFETGEIVSTTGERSGQIDVLVVPSSVPRLSIGDVCLGLVHGVAAALEIKSTLTTGGPDSAFSKALEACRVVKSLPINPIFDPWPWSACHLGGGNTRLENIPFSVLAFDGPEIETLMKQLDVWAANTDKHLLPNTITCLKRNYTVTVTDGWVLKAVDGGPQYEPSQTGHPALLDMFDYLMKVFQAWSYTQPRTPLNAYR